MQCMKYLQRVALKTQDFMFHALGFFSTNVTSASRRPAERWYLPKLSLTLSGGGERMLLRHPRCRPRCFRCLCVRRCVAMVHPVGACVYFRSPKTPHHLYLFPPLRRRPLVRSECRIVGQGLREAAGCNPFRRRVCTVQGLWIICSKARPSGNINNGGGICLPG